MKKTYQKPMIECIYCEVSVPLATSPNDQYSLGQQDSPNEQGGEIIDDHGGGPGVSGAKAWSGFDLEEDINM